ncbi:hypothetical protein NLI96_g4854 [Meripilus lineatus]|uniref:Uncharacterized protein n=1 Tax=Meripilus lineatus TaxID=2056292 RepID=A0AAD5YJQ1_9APHY|nr:hypothetical protein NLI96_g4854 [Physisporinus lineatus]
MSATSTSQIFVRGTIPLPDLTGDLENLAFEYRFVRSMWMISLVVVIYDYVLTFSDEDQGRVPVERQIHHSSIVVLCGAFSHQDPRVYQGSEPGLVSILAGAQSHFRQHQYVANPTTNMLYVDVFPFQSWRGTIHLNGCFIWYNWIIYAGLVSRLVVGLILLLRVHAMFERNKKLLVFLSTLLAIAVLGGALIAGIVSAQLKSFTLPQGYTGCAPTNIQSWAWTFWLPLLSFEVPVFILAIIKTVQVARDEYNSPHMMFILLRDSIMFFVIVLAVILVNCVIWASHNVGLFSAFPCALFAVQGILGCRMLVRYTPQNNPHSTLFTTLES